MGPPYVEICDQTYVLKGADLLTVECVRYIKTESKLFNPCRNNLLVASRVVIRCVLDLSRVAMWEVSYFMYTHKCKYWDPNI